MYNAFVQPYHTTLFTCQATIIFIFHRKRRVYTTVYCTATSVYCRSGNIREVLIFANFARTNSRIQESRENYYYHSATEEKCKFTKSKFRKKYENQ